ncbi:Patatin-like phospholipase [Geodermatophilus siccatus]|uniref:Patatin-like phospholipase n=1 Tax=Geodermatophilus siccatus TaxID=1137991 RepID=A0A1G9PRS5_9ACTN|nr:patatin-like phospholipase family protein [Geodermatophilus siccatus]SDM01508.1 Patatin-like phospholipase [Geodermatophilus siccatus]
MKPTTQVQRRISRTAAVARALAAVAAAGAGWVAYRQLAPPLPDLVRIGLGLDRPADPALLRDTLGPDVLLVLGYGSALAVLGRLARMMTWSRTSRHLADLGLLCAAATVVADLTENAFLFFGERAEWCYAAAGAAATVKWSAAVPAAVTALIGLVLTFARVIGNSRRRLRRFAAMDTSGIIPPPPLEPPPPDNVPERVPAAMLDSTRWRNAYRVPPDPRAATRSAEDGGPVAVCLSGGGVRSASVALGAVQALRPVVKEADYVISVSGGGYTAGALVQALTRGGSEDPRTDGVDRNPDNALAPGGVVEDHLRRHSSYLASTAGKLVLALALLARGLIGSLFVLFSGAVVVGVLVGAFYAAVPVTRLSHVAAAGSDSSVSYPVPHAPALYGLGVLAGVACLSWLAGVVLTSWRDQRSLACRLLLRTAQAAAALAAVVAAFVLVVPAISYATCWLYARTGDSSAITVGGPLVAVLLSYLATVAAAFWKKPGSVREFRERGKAARSTATTPASVLRLLLVTLVLALLAAVWLLVFGAAVATRADATALTVALVVGVLWVVVGGFVDETALSLHPFYRSRLASAFAVRARQGVAVPYLPSEPTTLSTHGRVHPDDWRSPGPRFVFAAAANLVDDDRTAPGLRAVSYVMSSDHIGGPDVGWVPTSVAIEACPQQLKRDLTVQAAVAISGAAFASAMGRASSWYGSLLAISGARLGSWLPHPDYLLLRQNLAAEDDWTLPGMPHVRRLPYLLREVLGVHPYFQRLLHVSDGGHYENLGLVEALRRRCRTIYVIDASGDAPPTAGTFGAALRLAHDELGVRIEPEEGFDLFDLVPGSGKPFEPEDPLAALNARLCKRGVVTMRITYPEESGLAPDQRTGVLVLAKAVLWPQLPYELLAYAASNPVFPHDSTADQWFDEGKFSSYKRLGHELGLRCRSLGEHTGDLSGSADGAGARGPTPPAPPVGNGAAVASAVSVAATVAGGRDLPPSHTEPGSNGRRSRGWLRTSRLNGSRR